MTSFDPIAGALAVGAARKVATSARPDAPVVPEAAVVASRAVRTRALTARTLHALARRVEPRRRTSGTCQTA